MTRIIIRACQERTSFVDYLLRHLPTAEVVWDQRHDAFDTLDRALAMAGGDAVVHMEDDALLTQGFRDKLECEIVQRPENVIQFFSMRGADLTIGSRWDRNYIMFQCTYLPSGYSAEFRPFAQNWHRKHPEHYGAMDFALRDFLKFRREAYWIVVPSLVDHRPVRSLLDSRRSTKRQSKTFTNPIYD